MSHFLLPCDCGAKVTISRSQAGMTVPCHQCAKQLQVPTIRNMSSLAIADSAELEKDSIAKRGLPSRSRSPWMLGLLSAVFMLVAIGSLAYASFIAYERYSIFADLKEAKVDLTKTEEDFISQIRAISLQASPADTWDYWNELTEQGLTEPNPPEFFRVKRYLGARKPVMEKWFAIGGVSLALFLGTAVLTQLMTKKS
jgi:hypothetical protein